MNLKGIIEVVRQSLKKPLVIAIVCFIAGLIIGLPILGWWILPVNWTDAAPEHLREDVKLDFLSMAVESYAYNQDGSSAMNRWTELGDDAKTLFTDLQNKTTLKAEDISSFGTLVGADISGVQGTSEEVSSSENEITVVVSSGESEPTATVIDEQTDETTKFKPILLLGVLCLSLLIVGGALLYILFLRKRTGNMIETKRHTEAVQEVKEIPHADEIDNETPTARFMTTFVVGDDLYDDSFSIDSPSGEFLGECGVGISETIGVGEPKKVAALEIWLFDKNDIQTVTKVLMSEYSFNDPVVNQRVVSKGEPVMLELDKVITLETATLRLEARVVDLTYGQGALPESSYFDRITMDLSIWPKA